MAYGIQIKNASGTITLDTTTRHGNLLVAPTTLSATTSATATGSPALFEGFTPYIGVPGITASNTADIQVHVMGIGTQGNSVGYQFLTKVTVMRINNNVRLKVRSYYQSTTFSYKVMVFRF